MAMNNEAIDVILHRRSVRRYEPEPIPPATVNTVLRAACAAPYGGFEPPVRFVVVRSAAAREALAKAEKDGVDRDWKAKPDREKYHNLFFSAAPVLVAVLFKPTSVGGFDARSEERIGLCSAACAIENMLLAAAALGLGACWVGPMPEAKGEFEAVLGVEAPWDFLALVAIGKPAEKARKDGPAALGDTVEFLD